MVPQPCLAVVLLFPYEALRDFKAAQASRVAASGQKVSDAIFYIKQYVGNACGTIAVVHALANNAAAVGLKPGHLSEFVEACRGKTAAEAGGLLGKVT